VRNIFASSHTEHWCKCSNSYCKTTKEDKCIEIGPEITKRKKKTIESKQRKEKNEIMMQIEYKDKNLYK
jgi:hypothetical protein